MNRGRRIALGGAIGVVGGGVLAATFGLGLNASAAGCTNSWLAASSGSWLTAANWSSGTVPSTADDACIVINGTYTVTLNGAGSVNSLKVGGTSGAQTLVVQGSVSGIASLNLAAASSTTSKGVISLDSTNGNYALMSGATIANAGTVSVVQGTGGGPRYVRASITNNASGKLTFTSNDVRIDQGTDITTSGTVTVAAGASVVKNGGSGTFTMNGGTLTNNGSLLVNFQTITQAGGTLAGTPMVARASTLVDSGGTGSIFLQGGSTLSGTIPAGQTVTVQGDVSGVAPITLSGTVTNNGTLVMDSTNGNYALLQGSTLVNNATFNVNQGGFGGTRYLRTDITNGATGTMTVTSNDARADQTHTLTNNGNLTVAAGGSLAINGGGSIVNSNAGSTLASAGSVFVTSTTFNQQGGTLTGTPIVVRASTLNVSAGTGSIVLQGSSSLSGTIPAGQTVALQGDASGVATITLSGASVVNNGTLVMDSTNGSYSLMTGSPLVNNAAFNVSQGAGAGTRYLRTDITNSATGTMAVTSNDARRDTGNTLTNDGTITMSAAGSLAITAGVVNSDTGSTLANAGSVFVSGSTFNQQGGTLTGTAVVVRASALNVSAGTGSIVLQGSSSLSGTIPAGQTVTLQGDASGVAFITLSGASVVNNGTLVMDSTNGSYSLLQGSPLVNNASFNVNQGAGGNRYLRVPITNSAGATMSVSSNVVQQDSNTTVTNSGTVTFTDGARIFQSGGSSFTNTATGTLASVLNVAGSTSPFQGGTLVTGGTLAITTVGTPVLTTAYVPISGVTVSGTFPSLQYFTRAYSTTYAATSITLTNTAPFTLTAKAVTATQGITVKNVAVGTVKDTTPTPPYTVTINWGDATQSTGTFSNTAGGGTAKGTHTYALPGSFTVTVTVHSADGTTITKTSTATVAPAPVPTVTSVTPAAVARKKSYTLTVNGTGFTTTSVPSFSAANITITSTTWVSSTQLTVKVSVKANATLGLGNVTVTTVGGVGTCTGCLTVNAAPTITTIAPNAVHGATTTVTVTGTGFQAGLTVTTTIPGATLGAPTAITATSFQITITTPISTTPGSYSLKVTNPDLGLATHAITVI